MTAPAPEDLARRMQVEKATWLREQYPSMEARRAMQEAYWATITGGLGVNPADLRDARIAVVGCGLGGVEWPILRDCPGSSVDAFDLVEPPAPPPAWAEALATYPGRLRYHPGTDVQESLPGGPYDFVVAASVIHHCCRPIDAAVSIFNALRPGGMLALVEYVGDRGISASPVRYAVADRIWQALPEAYKTTKHGGIQEHLRNQPAEAAGGMEAIRSDEIVDAFLSQFTVVRERRYAPLSGYRLIVWGEFRTRRINPDVDRLLDAFEDVLLAQGWLDGENWQALLRRPGSPS